MNGDVATKERKLVRRTKREEVYRTNTGVAKQDEPPPVADELPYFALAEDVAVGTMVIPRGAVVIPNPSKVYIVDAHALEHLVYSLVVTYGRGYTGPAAVSKLGRLFWAKTYVEAQEWFGKVKRSFLAWQHAEGLG